MAEARADFEKLVKECVGEDIAATIPVTNRNQLITLRQGLKQMALRLKSADKAKTSLITAEDWYNIKKFVWGVASIEILPAGYNSEEFSLSGTLKLMANPVIGFPIIFQTLAGQLIEKFETQNWGAVTKAKKGPIATDKPKKRGSDEKDDVTTAKKPKRTSLDKSQLRRPPTDHPIYGEQGIMRGVLRYQINGGGYSMALDDKYPIRDAKKFGHNGFKVGAWFARQIAALRDGCHGERVSGVSGDPDLGAWSIVVSKGGYEDIDKDLGNTIVYSAPGAFDAKSETSEVENRGTMCLLKSYESKRPIRVLRGNTKWRYAPPVGYRYDGLYQVEEMGEGKNAVDGLYKWFKLVRKDDQDPINKKSPTYDERRQEQKVTLGY